MRTFQIPVMWEMYGTVEVEANSVEEALKVATETEINGEGFALPTDGTYIDDSFDIQNDLDLIEHLNR